MDEAKQIQKPCNAVDLYIFNPKNYAAQAEWKTYNRMRIEVPVKINTTPGKQYYIYYKDEYNKSGSCAIPVYVFNATGNIIQGSVYLFPTNKYVIIGNDFKQDINVD